MTSVYEMQAVIPDTLPKPTGYHLGSHAKSRGKRSAESFSQRMLRRRKMLLLLLDRLLQLEKMPIQTPIQGFLSPWCKEGDWDHF